MALVINANKYVPSISIDMYKYLISKKKSKYIKDVKNIIRNYCIDYYLNVNTMMVKNRFGEDISTYLL